MLASMAYAGTYGGTGVESTNWGIEDYWFGGFYLFDGSTDTQADSVGCYLRVSDNHSFRAALVKRSSGINFELVDSTAEHELSADTGWCSFALLNSVTLDSGTYYGIILWSSADDDGDIYAVYSASGSDSLFYRASIEYEYGDTLRPWTMYLPTFLSVPAALYDVSSYFVTSEPSSGSKRKRAHHR